LLTTPCALESVLFAGRQGSMLDVDHARIHCYVVSAKPRRCIGAGVPPTCINGVIEYQRHITRVGQRSFPTRLTARRERIRQAGNEYGAVTAGAPLRMV